MNLAKLPPKQADLLTALLAAPLNVPWDSAPAKGLEVRGYAARTFRHPDGETKETLSATWAGHSYFWTPKPGNKAWYSRSEVMIMADLGDGRFQVQTHAGKLIVATRAKLMMSPSGSLMRLPYVEPAAPGTFRIEYLRADDDVMDATDDHASDLLLIRGTARDMMLARDAIYDLHSEDVDLEGDTLIGTAGLFRKAKPLHGPIVSEDGMRAEAVSRDFDRPFGFYLDVECVGALIAEIEEWLDERKEHIEAHQARLLKNFSKSLEGAMRAEAYRQYREAPTV